MEPGDIARADLRSYALRRCIRFYAALLLALLAVVGGALVAVSGHQEKEAVGLLVHGAGAGALLVLVVVELASGMVMARIAKACPNDGPEAGLWAFARGPGPSWLAAPFFAVLCGLLAWLAYRSAMS